jgi:hypothetical protein
LKGKPDKPTKGVVTLRPWEGLLGMCSNWFWWTWMLAVVRSRCVEFRSLHQRWRKRSISNIYIFPWTETAFIAGLTI